MGGQATLLTTLVEDPRRYGLVDRRDDGHIASFIEKPGEDWRGPGLINAGVYVLEHDVLAMIPPDREFSIERAVFPVLAGNGSDCTALSARATGVTSARPRATSKPTSTC